MNAVCCTLDSGGSLATALTCVAFINGFAVELVSLDSGSGVENQVAARSNTGARRIRIR